MQLLRNKKGGIILIRRRAIGNSFKPGGPTDGNSALNEAFQRFSLRFNKKRVGQTPPGPPANYSSEKGLLSNQWTIVDSLRIRLSTFQQWLNRFFRYVT